MRLKKTAQQLAKQVVWDCPRVSDVRVEKHGAAWAVELQDGPEHLTIYSPEQWAEERRFRRLPIVLNKQ